MKKQIAIVMLITMLLMPVATADVVSDLKLKVNEYNENTFQVPSFLKSIFGNEVIRLVITTGDGNDIYIKAVTENGYITTFEEVEEDTEIDQTLNVRASEATVQSVLASDDPVTAFIDAMESGEITVEPVGFVNTITFTVANVALKLSRLLGII